MLQARKIILGLAILGSLCFVAICAVAVYYLQAQENKDNAARTEAARKARWKKEPEKENEFKDLETIAPNENQKPD